MIVQNAYISGGSQALSCDTKKVWATIKAFSWSTGDVVDVHLLQLSLPWELKNILIQHIFPVQPSTESASSSSVSKQYLVFFKGPLKGEACVMDKIEGDWIWVKILADKKLIEHLRFNFMLSCQVKPKGDVKGSNKMLWSTLFINTETTETSML